MIVNKSDLCRVLHPVVPAAIQVCLNPFHLCWQLHVAIGTIVSCIEKDVLWRAYVCHELDWDKPCVVVFAVRAARI